MGRSEVLCKNYGYEGRCVGVVVVAIGEGRIWRVRCEVGWQMQILWSKNHVAYLSVAPNGTGQETD